MNFFTFISHLVSLQSKQPLFFSGVYSLRGEDKLKQRKKKRKGKEKKHKGSKGKEKKIKERGH